MTNKKQDDEFQPIPPELDAAPVQVAPDVTPTVVAQPEPEPVPKPKPKPRARRSKK